MPPFLRLPAVKWGEGGASSGLLGGGGLFSFPEAALRNCHKLGCLKQQKCVFSQFWKPKCETKASAGRAHPEAWGRSFLASLSSWRRLGVWLRAHHPGLCLSFTRRLLLRVAPISFCSSLTREGHFVTGLGRTQIDQDGLISRPLT